MDYSSYFSGVRGYKGNGDRQIDKWNSKKVSPDRESNKARDLEVLAAEMQAEFDTQNFFMDKQYQQNEDWYNAHSSPAAQVREMLAAGQNPDILGLQGTGDSPNASTDGAQADASPTSTPSGPSASDSSSIQAPMAIVDGVIEGVGGILSSVFDTARMTQENTMRDLDVYSRFKDVYSDLISEDPSYQASVAPLTEDELSLFGSTEEGSALYSSIHDSAVNSLPFSKRLPGRLRSLGISAFNDAYGSRKTSIAALKNRKDYEDIRHESIKSFGKNGGVSSFGLNSHSPISLDFNEKLLDYYIGMANIAAKYNKSYTSYQARLYQIKNPDFEAQYFNSQNQYNRDYFDSLNPELSAGAQNYRNTLDAINRPYIESMVEMRKEMDAFMDEVGKNGGFVGKALKYSWLRKSMEMNSWLSSPQQGSTFSDIAGAAATVAKFL